MKEMLEIVCKKHIFTSLIMIEPKALCSRKKVSIFNGVDQQSFYHVIFSLSQKSRFVIKNAKEFIELEQKLVLHVEHHYKYKHILLNNALLCSKAALLLRQNGWKVYP